MSCVSRKSALGFLHHQNSTQFLASDIPVVGNNLCECMRHSLVKFEDGAVLFILSLTLQ